MTGMHSTALGSSWDKQDELSLSQFFQSEMLPLYYRANPLAQYWLLSDYLLLSQPLCAETDKTSLVISFQYWSYSIDRHQSVSAAIHSLLSAK